MVRSLGGDAQGPYSTEQIIAAVDEGDLGVEIEVTPEGEDHWLPIEMVPEFADLAFFDGETNVVDAPWFADMARRGGLGPNRKVSETQMEAVSVTQASAPETATPQAPAPNPKPAVTQPPRPDKTLASAAQPTQAPRPGATRPLGTDVYSDEEVATKVVASPAELLEAAGGPPAAHGEPDLTDDSTIDWNPPSRDAASERFESVPPSASQPGDLYDDFDETMTRVAVRSDPAEPAVRPPAPGGGVLPTLTMNRDFLPATVNQPSYDAPGAQVARPGLGVDPLAATAKPFGADPVQPYAPPAPQAAAQPGPVQSPAAGAYPQQQPNFAQPYDPAQPTYQYAEAPEETNETGVKALIFLIIVLAMALTVVLVLLINQT